jgi:hypothetical protein
MSASFWEFPQSTGLTENELRQAVAEVVSSEFDVKLNVVSGLRPFIRAAFSQSSVQKLYRAMIASAEVREYVLGKIQFLSRLEIDLRYQNPNDTALSVLLLLTMLAAPENSRLVADIVYRAPQCWYAKKVAHRILNPPTIADNNVGDILASAEAINRSSGERNISLNLAYSLIRLSSRGKTELVAKATDNRLVEAFN